MKPLRKFLQAWRQASKSQYPAIALHSTDRMQGLLERERMRSDRGNSTFALLTLNFASPPGVEQLAEVDRVLAARIRATDDAGMLAVDRVGLILPETPVLGAWKLAEDLLDLLPAARRGIRCEVYIYPTDSDSIEANCNAEEASEPEYSKSETNGDSHQSDGHSRQNGHSRQGDAAAPKHREPASGVVAMSGLPRSAQPMNDLFVRPLPLWKRAFDIVISSLALVALSPLLLVVALAIKLTSPGPVIFLQRRDTLGGREFLIYKFRTMTTDAEARKASLRELSEQDGPAFKIAKDPRVTPLGRFLRSTSIDELPQLLNVLWGDMTLVGPRAMDSNESDACQMWQRRRLDVTAGITCIWQVRGRSSVSFADWMRMDLQYIQSHSATADLKLLVQTVPAVVLGRGAC